MATTTDEYLSIVRVGLQPRTAQPRKVIVVGAGMAGLVAAYELKRAGHAVTVLEARDRAGGRILTVHEPFSDGLYSEAGAMRLPGQHLLTRAYVETFGLPTMEFTAKSENAVVYYRGMRHLKRDVLADPSCLDANLVASGSGQFLPSLWDDELRAIAARLAADEDYWNELLRQFGDYSLRDYLWSKGWSMPNITAWAVLETMEPVMGASFLDLLQVELPWLVGGLFQIEGGMERLPGAFLPALEGHIILGAEVIAIDHTQDHVTLHYKSGDGMQRVDGDCAIVTIPFPALRFVDMVQPFSPEKQMAIRQLHYADAVKVMLQFRRRFWEEDEGIFGGGSITDLPIRQIYYPDHGRATGRGILIACYTYGEDVGAWRSLSNEERISQTLKYLARIHPQAEVEFEVGTSKIWGEDRFAGGAFAQFEAGQQSRLHHHVVSPEGPVHFAGEHTSLKHMWIEGAVESGLRAARDVHRRALQSV